MTSLTKEEVVELIHTETRHCFECAAARRVERERKQVERYTAVLALPVPERLATLREMSALDRRKCLVSVTLDYVVDFVRDLAPADRDFVMESVPAAIVRSVPYWLTDLIQYVEIIAGHKLDDEIVGRKLVGRTRQVRIDDPAFAETLERLGVRLKSSSGAKWWMGLDLSERRWVMTVEACDALLAVDSELNAYVARGAIEIHRLPERACRAIMESEASNIAPTKPRVYSVTPGIVVRS